MGLLDTREQLGPRQCDARQSSRAGAGETFTHYKIHVGSDITEFGFTHWF
jgi:hypothetical protein